MAVIIFDNVFRGWPLECYGHQGIQVGQDCDVWFIDTVGAPGSRYRYGILGFCEPAVLTVHPISLAITDNCRRETAPSYTSGLRLPLPGTPVVAASGCFSLHRTIMVWVVSTSLFHHNVLRKLSLDPICFRTSTQEIKAAFDWSWGQ